MKSIVFATLMLAALAGCQTSKGSIVVDNSRFIVIKPPAAIINCPAAGKIPDPNTATNQQVADYLARLYKAHKVCRISADQIRAYIAKAEKTYKQS